MPQPSVNEVHVDAILTNISVAYIQRQENFVASRVFPIVPVDKQSDKYFVYTKADWFRDEARIRTDGAESAGSGYGLSSKTYLADVYALHKDVGDQVLRNSDNPLNPFRDATEFVTQRLLLRQEIQWASDYFTTGVWDTDAVPSPKWSDFAGSDPIDDVEAGKEKILSTTGYMPNILVMGYEVFRKLKQHPDIIDRIKYTGGATRPVTEELLAQLFGIDRVLVAKAIKNTANEGATAAFAFTHGKNALLCYAAPSPSLLSPTAGYTFAWRGVSEGIGADIGISRFRMEELKATRIEGQKAWDNAVVATDMGYFFSAAVA